MDVQFLENIYGLNNMSQEIAGLLEKKYLQFNEPGFLSDDPVSIPHRLETLQDIEIIGFWTAGLAWGQRKTVIRSAETLIGLMDGAPLDFVRNHEEKDRKRFEGFKHRTFQYLDTLYFLEFFQQYYRNHNSLEDAFARFLHAEDPTIEPALIGFHELFFSLPEAPKRTKKHVPTPKKNASCKRLNMFLRWMVRSDHRGVDFGLWKNIQTSQLLIPLDVHVERVARRLGLLTRKQTDWKSVLELTDNLRNFDPTDPVKYDYALFGMGVLEKKTLF